MLRPLRGHVWLKYKWHDAALAPVEPQYEWHDAALALVQIQYEWHDASRAPVEPQYEWHDTALALLRFNMGVMTLLGPLLSLNMSGMTQLWRMLRFNMSGMTQLGPLSSLRKTFEKHLRFVSRAAFQRLGILSKFRRVLFARESIKEVTLHEMLSRFSPARFGVLFCSGLLRCRYTPSTALSGVPLF